MIVALQGQQVGSIPRRTRRTSDFPQAHGTTVDFPEHTLSKATNVTAPVLSTLSRSKKYRSTTARSTALLERPAILQQPLKDPRPSAIPTPRVVDRVHMEALALKLEDSLNLFLEAENAMNAEQVFFQAAAQAIEAQEQASASMEAFELVPHIQVMSQQRRELTAAANIFDWSKKPQLPVRPRQRSPKLTGTTAAATATLPRMASCTQVERITEGIAESKKKHKMSRQEEADLIRVVQDALRLKELQAQLASQIKRPPSWEELGAFTNIDARTLPRIFQLGNEAKEHIVRCNLGLVHSFAWKHHGRGIPMEDLVAEGTKGLVRALTTFDASKGFRLSTYATWWIKVRLQEAERNQSGLIRLTAQATAEVNKVRQTWARLTEREGREPSEKEMLSELGWPLSKLQRANAAFKILNRPISLESSRQGAGDQGVEAVEVDSRELGGEDDDGTESFTASWPRTAEEVVERELMQRAIEHDIGHRAKMVMTMRHGLKGGEKRATLQEIGEVLGVVTESVRQIESRALIKLRKNAELNAAITECLSSAGHIPMRAGVLRNK